LDHLRYSGLDILFRLRGHVEAPSTVTIIEIDDDNIDRIGRWPWERSWHSAMIAALKTFGAKEIYFDILFSENSNIDDDTLFQDQIKKAGNVYLPYAFRESSINIDDAVKPIDIFYNNLKGTGAINIYPDSDGALRKIPLFFVDREKVYHHIALQLALDHLGAKIKEIGYKSITISFDGQEMNIPLVEKNKILVNWLGKWKDTFTHFSFLDVLNAYNDQLEGKPLQIDVSAFKDSTCIVAATAIGLYDIKPSPLEFAYPGAGVTATAIDSIVNKKFITMPYIWINLVLIFMLALLPALFISGEKSLREISFIIILATSFFFIVFYLFKKFGIWVEFMLPLLSLFGSYLAVGTYNFVRISIERKKFLKLAITDELTGLFNIRYFMTILGNECSMAHVDPTKGFCVLMADIDNFKAFNDNHGHQIGDFILSKVADILKISVRSSDVVARYGGEEMIMLLRGTDIKGAMIVAEKARKNIQDFLFKDKDFVYRVTLSIGVSCYGHDNEESIIKRADDALYKAKHLGRNRSETNEEIPEY